MFAQNKPDSIILCALSTLVLTGAPYKIGFDGPQPTLSVPEASAKEGKGTGSKNGGASGKDASAGNNKGSGGKAGSPESSGKGPGGTRERPDKKSGGTSSVTKAQQTKRLIDGNDRSGRSIAILHSNGMREEISGDRYEMRDAGGRTIVNRPATQSDLARLLRFQR